MSLPTSVPPYFLTSEWALPNKTASRYLSHKILLHWPGLLSKIRPVARE